MVETMTPGNAALAAKYYTEWVAAAPSIGTQIDQLAATVDRVTGLFANVADNSDAATAAGYGADASVVIGSLLAAKTETVKGAFTKIAYGAGMTLNQLLDLLKDAE